MISEAQKIEREKIKKALRKERNHQYYASIPRRTCEVCCIDVVQTYWDKHVNTIRHKRWSAVRNPPPSPTSSVKSE